jgi:hypothetical protein
MCKGGVWGSGPQTDKHLPQSPFRGQFFLDDDILHCLLRVLSFYGLCVGAGPGHLPTAGALEQTRPSDHPQQACSPLPHHRL